MKSVEYDDGSFVVMRDFVEDTRDMFTQRLILEELGIRPKELPLCDEFVARKLALFFTRVEEQCLMRVRSDRQTPEVDLDMWNYLRSVEANTVHAIEYWTFVASYVNLGRLGNVSLNSFETLPSNLTGAVLDRSTFWNLRFDPSSLLEVVSDLDRTALAALEDSDRVGIDNLLRAAHFFGMSADMLAPLCPGTDSNRRPTA